VGAVLTQKTAPDSTQENPATQTTNEQTEVQGVSTVRATDALKKLAVKGRAPKTGYAREQFGAGWSEINSCDTRQVILRRDLTNVALADDDCKVLSGTLNDPYTGKSIEFRRGQGTSDDVQIDHVVALSDAWQTGAQQLDIAERTQFANDPLELLAVDGPANEQKGDADAASWLPSNKAYRCRYVARQIAVKEKYDLWVTSAEHNAMEDVLSSCPTQMLPIEQ
jgi:hypothetical protein